MAEERDVFYDMITCSFMTMLVYSLLNSRYLHAEEARVTRASFSSRGVTMTQVSQC